MYIKQFAIVRFSILIVFIFILPIFFFQSLITAEQKLCQEMYGESFEIYLQAGYASAIKKIEDAYNCFLRESNGEETGESVTCIYNIGEIYYEQGKNELALGYFIMALALELKIHGDNHPNTARAYNNVGVTFLEIGENERALENLYKAHAINLRIYGVNHKATATTYHGLGTAYDEHGDYEMALVCYKHALSINLRILGYNHPNTARTYSSVGLVYYHQGKYRLAMVNHSKALKIYMKVYGIESTYTATTYNNLGLLYHKQGDYNRALVNFKGALKILKNVVDEDNMEIAYTYNNIGLVCSDQQDYDCALENYKKALEIKLKVSDGRENQSTATSYTNIGFVYSMKSEYEQALEYYNKALSIDLRTVDPDAATVYNNIGLVYNKKGEYEQALEYYNKALSIDLRTVGKNNPNTAIGYNNIGEVYYKQGDIERALEYYNESLSSLCKVKQNRSATDCRPEATTIIGFYHRGIALAELANSTKESSKREALFAEAASAFENAAIALDRRRENIQSKSAIRYLSGNYYEIFPKGIGVFVVLAEGTGDDTYFERAFVFAEKGIGYVLREMLRQNSELMDLSLLDDIAKNGAYLKAQWQTAFDAVQNIESQPKDKQSGLAREAVYERLNQVETNMEAYETRLLKGYPDYAELKHPRTRSLAEIRDKVIAPNEAALEYHLGEDASYLIFITRENIKIKQLPAMKEIMELVIEYRYRMMPFECSYPMFRFDNCTSAKGEDCNPILDELNKCMEIIACMYRGSCTKRGIITKFTPEAVKVGKRLYDTLIGPVTEDIANYDKLLIVPTADLFFLPFEALVTEAGEKTGYFAESHEIRYAPSLNVAYLVGDRHVKRGGDWGRYKNWVGFGDPMYEDPKTSRCKPPDNRMGNRGYSDDTNAMLANYPRALGEVRELGGWCRIPGSREEVIAVGALFGVATGSLDLNIGLEANEKRFKALAQSGSRYILIASHGTLGEGGAGEPAVVLSLVGNENTGEDGFITMTEILNMKIPTDMIVLSACKSGAGHLANGEGLAGLSSAFLYSGANSLVVSLWSVADEQTKELMVSFYQNLLDGADKETALVQTKREMIKKGIQPFYWAPFIFIGAN